MRAKLPIGRDGRNRPSLFPFGTATGRNAHAKSLYNAHAGMRSFMVFPADTIGVYLDWRTQEVGIAAALSGDQALMARLSRRRRLSRARQLVRPDRRPRSEALEEEQPGDAASHEAAAAGDQLRHGRAVAGQRSRSAPADCQRPSSSGTSGPTRGSGSGARSRCRPRCWIGAIETRVRLAAVPQPPAPTSARSTISRCKAAAPKCCGWRRGGCARPASSRAC